MSVGEIIENKYQKGKIYKLTSTKTDRIYIGSTPRLLSARMAEHRKDYKVFNNPEVPKGTRYNHYRTAYELMGFPDVKIELIEKFPCNSKEELLIREGIWIKSSHLTPFCVNKQVAGRKFKEYYQDNIEYYREKERTYRLGNRDKIVKRQREYRKRVKALKNLNNTTVG